MISQPDVPSGLSPQEYLDWEAQQEYRYEYIDGEIIAMTGELFLIMTLPSTFTAP